MEPQSNGGTYFYSGTDAQLYNNYKDSDPESSLVNYILLQFFTKNVSNVNIMKCFIVTTYIPIGVIIFI